MPLSSRFVVDLDGTTEQITTPVDPTDANTMDIRVVGTLTPDGLFGGRVTVQGSGTVALGLRAAMATRMDSTQREAFLRSAAGAWFPNSKGDSLVTFDGKDLSAKPIITYVIRDGQATQQSGNTDVLIWHDASGLGHGPPTSWRPICRGACR